MPLLLLLRLGRVRRLRPALRPGLRHPGRLLRVCRLPGDLHGVLWALLLLLTRQGPSSVIPAGMAPGLSCKALSAPSPGPVSPTRAFSEPQPSEKRARSRGHRHKSWAHYREPVLLLATRDRQHRGPRWGGLGWELPLDQLPGLQNTVKVGGGGRNRGRQGWAGLCASLPLTAPGAHLPLPPQA